MADPKKFYTYNRGYIDTKLGHGLSYSLTNNVLTLNLLDKTGNVISTQAITLSGKLADVVYNDTTKVLTVKYADGTADATYTLKNFVSGTFEKVTGTGNEGKINLNIKDVATSTDIINTTIEQVVFEEDSQTLKNKTINTNENTITKATDATATTPLFGIVEADGTTLKSTDGVLSVKQKYSIAEQATAETGFLKTYTLQLDGVDVTGAAKINIPKDFLVKSATVKTCTEDDKPVAGYKVGDKYIDFVVNVKSGTATDDHIYLLVKELVDPYTAGDGLVLDSNNRFNVELSTSKSGLTLNGTSPDKTLEVVTDNSTVEVDATNNTIQVKDSGIVTSKIADTNVTLAKLNDDVATKTYDIKLLSDTPTDPDYGVLEFTQLRANS